MTPVPTDEQLEALLRRPTPYLDDAGFTARVLTSLPPPRSRERLRTAVLAGAALAACTAFALGPARGAWVGALGALQAEGAYWPGFALGALSVVVLAATALSAALREAES